MTTQSSGLDLSSCLRLHQLEADHVGSPPKDPSSLSLARSCSRLMQRRGCPFGVPHEARGRSCARGERSQPEAKGGPGADGPASNAARGPCSVPRAERAEFSDEIEVHLSHILRGAGGAAVTRLGSILRLSQSHHRLC